MANSECKKWLTSDLDFYEILGIEFEACSESELRRAYRKTALKYHPDKVGINFDPEKYEIFQAAYHILSDSSLKSQYDQFRHAKIQKQRANDMFEGKRRRMKEELEAREKNGVPNVNKRSRENEARQMELQPELKRLAEEGRKRRAVREKKMAENAMSSPSSVPLKEGCYSKDAETKVKNMEDDEKIKRLEQKIREAEEAKAKYKLKRKVEKGSPKILVDNESLYNGTRFEEQGNQTSQPIPSISKGIPLDEKSSSAKFSSLPTSYKDDFATTMARLRAAEKARQETS
ncbi:Pre-mRNA-splicing factor cwf23 [Erysiphe necator]|nr:Pre-mRNA-splicing factor cwf23 [Erysiphe necator]